MSNENEYLYSLLVTNLWLCGYWLAPEEKKRPFVIMVASSAFLLAIRMLP